jgi:hypothetical protein
MAMVRQDIRPDEGTTSRYMARLWVGISELRDAILTAPEEWRQFDERYEPIVRALDKARESAREIVTLVEDHHDALGQAGAVALYPDGRITVHIAVNDILDRRFDSFTLFAHRAMKLTQYLAENVAGLKIGFLFQKPSSFEQGYKALQSSHPDLACYLLAVREQVTQTLADLRNTIEHNGWRMEAMHYKQHDGKLRISKAKIEDVVFTSYMKHILKAAMRFCEDVAAYTLQMRIDAQSAIIELADEQRASLLPKRFAIGRLGDDRTWCLKWAEDPADFLWKG